MVNFEILPVTRDKLGEGPWWHQSRQVLFWVDILGRKIRSATLDGDDSWEVSTPSDVGFAVPAGSELMLVGLREGLAKLDQRSGEIEVLWEGLPDSSDHRINDGKTDRFGRVFFGTMHDQETDKTSAFYRADLTGTTRLLDGVTTSNGLGWSPDNKFFYYTDSIARTIWRFSYDSGTGRIFDREVFAKDPDGYVPDGLTVDESGCVWSAKWNGSKLVRYAPTGLVDRVVEVPVKKPTSAMFCGPKLDVLAVTTANLHPETDGELAGAVLLLDVKERGIAEVPAQEGVLEALAIGRSQGQRKEK